MEVVGRDAGLSKEKEGALQMEMQEKAARVLGGLAQLEGGKRWLEERGKQAKQQK